jgi:hypothetical protein
MLDEGPSEPRVGSLTIIVDHNDIRHSPIEQVTWEAKFPGERRQATTRDGEPIWTVYLELSRVPPSKITVKGARVARDGATRHPGP